MSAADVAIRQAKEPGRWTPGPWTTYALENGTWAGGTEDRPIPPLWWAMSQDDARLIALAPEMAELLALVADNRIDQHFAARDLLARARGSK